MRERYQLLKSIGRFLHERAWISYPRFSQSSGVARNAKKSRNLRHCAAPVVRSVARRFPTSAPAGVGVILGGHRLRFDARSTIEKFFKKFFCALANVLGTFSNL
jgi:hypothetical protein